MNSGVALFIGVHKSVGCPLFLHTSVTQTEDQVSDLSLHFPRFECFCMSTLQPPSFVSLALGPSSGEAHNLFDMFLPSTRVPCCAYFIFVFRGRCPRNYYSKGFAVACGPPPLLLPPFACPFTPSSLCGEGNYSDILVC